MYEVIIKVDKEEYTCGEFYTKRGAENYLENLYETKIIDSDIESWIERC